jgi:hemoglobin-like flavoprotein
MGWKVVISRTDSKATVPALETHGLTITRRMYERMFQNPDIRDQQFSFCRFG